jgi:hypothetical protein
MMSSGQTVPSLSIADPLTHACVTASDEWGYGVFSWHNNEADARHNARVTGGRCVPVSYVDGTPATPHAARHALGHYFGAPL